MLPHDMTPPLSPSRSRATSQAWRLRAWLCLTACVVLGALASPSVAVAQDAAPNAPPAQNAVSDPGSMQAQAIDLGNAKDVRARIAEISQEIELTQGESAEAAGQVTLLRREQELLSMHERLMRRFAPGSQAIDLVAVVQEARDDRAAARAERLALNVEAAVAHLKDEASIGVLQSRIAAEFLQPLVDARQRLARARSVDREFDGELSRWAGNLALGMRELAAESEQLRVAQRAVEDSSESDPSVRMTLVLRTRVHYVAVDFQRFWLAYLNRRRPSLPSLLEAARLRADAADARLESAELLAAAARELLGARMLAERAEATSELAKLEAAGPPDPAEALPTERLATAQMRRDLALLRVEVERVESATEKAAEYVHVASEEYTALVDELAPAAVTADRVSPERRRRLNSATSPPMGELDTAVRRLTADPIDLALLRTQLSVRLEGLDAHFDELRSGVATDATTDVARSLTDLEFQQRDHLGATIEQIDRVFMLRRAFDECAAMLSMFRGSSRSLLTRGSLLSRGRSPYTMETVERSVERMRTLPAQSRASWDAVRSYLTATAGREATSRVAIGSLFGLAVLLLLRLRVGRRIRRAGELRGDDAAVEDGEAESATPVQPAAPGAGWRLTAALLTGAALALPFVLSALLLPGLSPEAADVLVGTAVCLVLLVAGRALLAATIGGPDAVGGWRPLPEDARLLLRSGLYWLFGVSVVLLPVVSIQTAVLRDEDGADVVLGIYELAVVIILLSTIARKPVLEALLPAGTDAPSRALKRSLASLHPVLYLLIPTVLMIEVLGYRALASGITTLFASIVIAAVVGQIVYRATWTRFEKRFPRHAHADPVLEQRAESRAALSRFVLSTTVAVVMIGLVLSTIATDLSTLRTFFDVPLPLQAADSERSVTWWNVIVGLSITCGFVYLRPKLVMLLRDVLLPRSTLKADLRYTITVLAGYVWLVVGVVLGAVQVFNLSALGYVVTGLSVGVGFGLQQIVADFFSGLILLFERPLKVGDVVDVDGKSGVVKQISLRATTIQTLENVSLLIPNRKFVEEQVVNYEYSDPIVRVDIAVGVAYGSDRALVEQLLLSAAHSVPTVLRSRAPFVLFEGFGESSLDFILVVWIAQSRERRIIMSAVRAAIDEAFRANGVTIPFPQRDVHIDRLRLATDADSPRAELAESDESGADESGS